jgi:hypothetical protein
MNDTILPNRKAQLFSGSFNSCFLPLKKKKKGQWLETVLTTTLEAERQRGLLESMCKNVFHSPVEFLTKY